MNYKLLLVLTVYLCNLSSAHILNKLKSRPPVARYRYNEQYSVEHDEIDSEIDDWKPEDGTNVWEHSGLFEGDIMLYEQSSPRGKNGLIDIAARWPRATVPYYIDDAFTNEEVWQILGSMQEYHNKTCIRFRPYEQTDQNWIDIKPDYSGCWSSVGMRKRGQVINFGSPKCLRHGVIIHELMHAIGFFHQQSAAERDDFVEIVWENIRAGREHNFNKYNETVVSSYNETYDYNSVMHYSSKAFSRNGSNTIEPLNEIDAPLGQRVGLSDIDIKKINSMYSDECNVHFINVFEQHEIQEELQQEVAPPRPYKGNYIAAVIKWVEDIFTFSFW